MSNKEFSVLLLEADNMRADNLETIFQTCNKCSRITKVKSQLEATELLENSYKQNRVMPSIIIAYLLPEDLDFVRKIKNHSTFKHIPVIGYGDKNSQEEINDFYRQHINCFVESSADEKDFTNNFERIFMYWSEIVKLIYNEKYLL